MITLEMTTRSPGRAATPFSETNCDNSSVAWSHHSIFDLQSLFTDGKQAARKNAFGRQIAHHQHFRLRRHFFR